MAPHRRDGAALTKSTTAVTTSCYSSARFGGSVAAASACRPDGVSLTSRSSMPTPARDTTSTRPMLVASAHAGIRGHDVRHASMVSR